MKTALLGGVLLDGRGGPPRPGATIVLDGSRIEAVCHERRFGPDVRVIDLEGRTVMPGLIDCHVHLAPWATRLVGHPDQRLMELAAEAVRALRLTLEGGCTTARDLGGLDPGFRDAVEHGVVPAAPGQLHHRLAHQRHDRSGHAPGHPLAVRARYAGARV